MIKRELTVEEKNKPYAKYYDIPMQMPEQALLDKIHNRISVEQILRPEQVALLFSDGVECDQIGWAVTGDGMGYVASRVEMPGVTPAMIAWWFAWHPLESLRYMIWYPGRHFSANVGEDDRKKILDPTIPLEEKFVDVNHIIQEDSRENDALTEIPPAFHISFRKPEDMGISQEMVGYPDQGVVVIASPKRNEDGSLPERPRIMMHYAKNTDNGVVFYSRFWMGGYVLEDGKPNSVEIKNPTPETAPPKLLEHCIREYTNLAAFLPKLYEEMEGKISL